MSEYCVFDRRLKKCSRNIPQTLAQKYPRTEQGEKERAVLFSLYFYKCALYLFLNMKEARCQDDVNLNTFNLKQLEF